MSIESVIPSNHLLLCHPFSSCFPSFLGSGSFPVREFFVSGGQSIGASASASILPMNIQGPISFRMDWLDLFAVQVILNSCLQHHSSKASILGHSAGPNLTCIHDYWKNHSFNWTDLCWQINVSAFLICFLG